MIDTAIKRAENEHVVYFLLTSYLHVRASGDHHLLPPRVTRLPIAGKSDVHERLRELSAAALDKAPQRDKASPLVKETFAVLTAASQRIASLGEGPQCGGSRSPAA